eukprot:8118667-Alexandrium_andersonii.AAC.1
MSASLVGSEMCIRDRSRGSPKLRVCRNSIPLKQSLFRALRRAPESYGAVSYTHLTLPTICSV